MVNKFGPCFRDEIVVLGVQDVGVQRLGIGHGIQVGLGNIEWILNIHVVPVGVMYVDCHYVS